MKKQIVKRKNEDYIIVSEYQLLNLIIKNPALLNDHDF